MCATVCALVSLVQPALATAETVWKELPFREQALDESVRPIRPGVPGERSFWNVAAKRLMYAPAFNFKAVKGAATYRFTLTAEEKTLTFTAERPWAPPSPVWRDVPVAMVNLTRGSPAGIARLILERYPDDPKWVAEAEDLIRFCEDQFVVWEQPWPGHMKVKIWHQPCVLEQYECYMPIDSSACSMIQAYGKAYEVTGKPIYKAKACDLANQMTVEQDARTGLIPTYWQRGGLRHPPLAQLSGQRCADAPVVR